MGKTRRKLNSRRTQAEVSIPRKQLRTQIRQTRTAPNIKNRHQHYQQKTTGKTYPRENAKPEDHEHSNQYS